MIREAGVTRLAELTGLDCVGVPVWQAVRPGSRALSVHLGKGLDNATAQRGATMEAIESHHAEHWRPPQTRIAAAWSALDPATRTAAADDCAWQRGGVDLETTVDWVSVEPLISSRPFQVPVDCVSLDCTISAHAGLARDSNGQAAHFEHDAALLAGLLELIERDAVCEWRTRSAVARSGCEVDVSTLDDPALGDIAARLAARAIGLRIYRVPAIIEIAVIVAEVADHLGGRSSYTYVWGSAAAPDPRAAVRAAVLEALQTRCSQIAGSRDTIPIAAPAPSVPRLMALPVLPGWRGHAFEAHSSVIGDTVGIVEALAAVGYRQAGFVTLSPPESAAVTIKAFVPGLGFEYRRRRAV